MNSFLEGLAEDLRVFEAAQAARNPQATGQSNARLASEDLRMLAHMRSETLRVAAITAGVASIANALARNGSEGTVAPYAMPIVPALSTRLSEQLSRQGNTEMFFEVYQHWFAAESKLAFAQELSLAIVREPLNADSFQVLHADAVADAWCRVCTSMIALLRGLAGAMEGEGVSISPQNESDVISLLEKAAAGESPCIERDGSFSLPGWAERRKERRRTLSVPVKISVGIKRFPATVQNISTGGMQIATGFMIPVGSRIVVHLETDRELDASVRWSNGTTIGIALARSLENSDPLWTADFSLN